MERLRQWDFAESFSGEQMACLIVGIDPLQVGYERARIFPVLNRLESSYIATRRWQQIDAIPFGNSGSPPDPMILSIGMAAHIDTDDDYDWLTLDDSEFENQHFSRKAIAEWLAALGLFSVYSFALPGQDTGGAGGHDKPLTLRERNMLLTIIGVLADAANFDISAPSKTAEAIVSAAALAGIALSRTGVANHLRAVPEAMATRQK